MCFTTDTFIFVVLWNPYFYIILDDNVSADDGGEAGHGDLCSLLITDHSNVVKAPTRPCVTSTSQKAKGKMSPNESLFVT